jgi:DNA-binding response OmpR family regulator
VGTGKILVVDDDEWNRRLISALLGTQGYTVTVASHAEHALELLASAPFELIVSDIMMAQMDGVDLAHQIRASSDPDIPIILLTSLDDRETRIRACDVADHVMVKPPDTLEFLLRVEQMLKTRRRMVALRSELREVKLELAGLRQDNTGVVRTNTSLVVPSAPMAKNALIARLRRPSS